MEQVQRMIENAERLGHPTQIAAFAIALTTGQLAQSLCCWCAEPVPGSVYRLRAGGECSRCSYVGRDALVVVAGVNLVKVVQVDPEEQAERIVAALNDCLERLSPDEPFGLDVAAMLRSWHESRWTMLARVAGIVAPTPEVRQLVLQHYTGAVSGVLPRDPWRPFESASLRRT